MIGTILQYGGEKPSAIGSPDLEKVFELFKQQNELLKVAMTTCVLLPEDTRVRPITTQAPAPNESPP